MAETRTESPFTPNRSEKNVAEFMISTSPWLQDENNNISARELVAKG